jgi:hypothetical protein
LSLDLRYLDAGVRDYKQIYHRHGFLHCDLLHGLDVADSVVEGVDDLDVLNVRDSVPSVVEIFHIVPKAFNMLLHVGLEGLSSRWTLIRALEVPDENGT